MPSPTEQNIERVLKDPFVPDTFNKRVKGMGVGEELTGDAQDQAMERWLTARDMAAHAAEKINELGVDKSRANRLLEPFMYHTVIVTSTEWDNFLALRCPPGNEPDPDFPAQLEIQLAAICMRDAMDGSIPKSLAQGDWHQPLVTGDDISAVARAFTPAQEGDLDLLNEQLNRISTRRTARVSYDKHTDTEATGDSIAKAAFLIDDGHFSPTEHPARQFTKHEWIAVEDCQDRLSVFEDRIDPLILASMKRELEFLGNFRGYVQYRKTIPNEHNHALALAG